MAGERVDQTQPTARRWHLRPQAVGWSLFARFRVGPTFIARVQGRYVAASTETKRWYHLGTNRLPAASFMHICVYVPGSYAANNTRVVPLRAARFLASFAIPQTMSTTPYKRRLADVG